MNTDAVQERITSIDAAMLGFLKTQSRDDGGIAPYYLRRIDDGHILDLYDRAAIHFLCKRHNEGIEIIEAAAGLAQLSIALSLLGYNQVTAFDCSKPRFSLASAMAKVLGARLVIVHADWRLIRDVIPDHQWKPTHLWTTINAAAGRNCNDDESIFREMLEAGVRLIVDPKRYGADGVCPNWLLERRTCIIDNDLAYFE